MKKIFLGYFLMMSFSGLVSADPGEARTTICGIQVWTKNIITPARGVTVENFVENSRELLGATSIKVCLIKGAVAAVTNEEGYEPSAMLWRLKD